MVTVSEVRDVPVGNLTVSRYQVRTHDVRRSLEELVDNIRVHGQLEPILVCPNGDADQYEIIAGQRRWLAMKSLGYSSIRAVVLDSPVGEEMARTLSISENLVRHEVSSKDMIDACTKLYHKYGTVKAVAEDTGLPYNRVRAYIKFDRLRQSLKSAVETGELDVNTALKVEDYCSTNNANETQVNAIVDDVKGLTNAQRKDYFVRSGHHRDRTQPDSQARPGNVHQILVTLPNGDYKSLKEVAARSHLTQDQAAARIISSYFRAQAGRGSRLSQHHR